VKAGAGETHFTFAVKRVNNIAFSQIMIQFEL
jgi:hypothetical protein